MIGPLDVVNDEIGGRVLLESDIILACTGGGVSPFKISSSRPRRLRVESSPFRPLGSVLDALDDRW